MQAYVYRVYFGVMETSIEEIEDLAFHHFVAALNLLAFEDGRQGGCGDCVVVEGYSYELLLGAHGQTYDLGRSSIAYEPLLG